MIDDQTKTRLHQEVAAALDAVETAAKKLIEFDSSSIQPYINGIRMTMDNFIDEHVSRNENENFTENAHLREEVVE